MQEIQINETDLKKIFKTDTPLGKFFKVTKRLLGQCLYLVVLFLIFYYAINYSAFWKRLEYSLKTKTPPPVEEPAPKPIVTPLPDYAPEIQIPKLSITAPISLEVLNEEVVSKLAEGVVHFADTALPGQIGNTVIFGHSSDYPWSTGKYKTVFALLDKLAPGDEIIIPYKTQRYVYKVREQKVVKPTEVSVLARTPDARLTLITCYPVGSTRSRYIVIAELTSGVTTGTQQVSPPIDEIPKPR